MIYDEGLGDTSLKQEYGYTLSALGSSYRYLGQYDKAEGYLKEALKIFRAADSPNRLRVKNNDDDDDDDDDDNNKTTFIQILLRLYIWGFFCLFCGKDRFCCVKCVISKDAV